MLIVVKQNLPNAFTQERLQHSSNMPDIDPITNISPFRNLLTRYTRAEDGRQKPLAKYFTDP